MVKGSRGRPKVSFFDQSPEFFEVYLPDRNSHQLRIPPDFIKNFEGKIPEKSILKDLSGRFWHVDLEKEKKGLFFKKGWHCFVNDSSLKLGEFIVFRYNRSSAFTVRIFGRSGCKKEETLDIEKTVKFVKKEKESEPEPSFIGKRKHSYTCPKPSENTVKIAKREKESKPELSPIRKRKYSEAIPRTPEKPRGSQEVSCLTKVNVSKNSKIDEDFEAEEPVLPKRLSFSTSISHSKPWQLHIPKLLMDSYCIKLNSYVVLRNPRGETWRVEIIITSDHRKKLSTGWLDFCIDNGIEDDDKLELTLVLSKGRICKEFQVNIERARHKWT